MPQRKRYRRRALWRARPGSAKSDRAAALQSAPGGAINQATGLEILDHAPVTVEEHDCLAGPAIDIVQPDSVHFDELPDRRIIAFGLARDDIAKDFRAEISRITAG